MNTLIVQDGIPEHWKTETKTEPKQIVSSPIGKEAERLQKQVSEAAKQLAEARAKDSAISDQLDFLASEFRDSVTRAANAAATLQQTLARIEKGEQEMRQIIGRLEKPTSDDVARNLIVELGVRDLTAPLVEELRLQVPIKRNAFVEFAELHKIPKALWPDGIE